LINPGDVVLMKIPYPDAASGLATVAHMYICVGNREFVKCQSKKPYHAFPGAFPINRIETVEPPFRHATLIDMDKLFVVSEESLPKLKTGVSAELLAYILEKLGDVERVEF